jgi:hypothetical protein
MSVAHRNKEFYATLIETSIPLVSGILSNPRIDKLVDNFFVADSSIWHILALDRDINSVICCKVKKPLLLLHSTIEQFLFIALQKNWHDVFPQSALIKESFS